MSVPMLDLRPMLAETEPLWRAHLARLFERMQFVLGEQVAAFEREFAAALGARFAVAVASGTAAIELGLRAAGLAASGAEVIVPALTSPFTAQAVLAAGCRPRFADVDPVHLLLDPASAEDHCGRRTRALVRAMVPVHLYGQPCDMGPLGELARSRGLTIVQDACQAHGARSGGQPLTRFSPAVAYSFYPTKNLPCLGDGGALLTDSASVAKKLRRLRDGGRNNDQVARMPAINARLDEMQACYLRAFLGKLEEWNARRVRLARLYDEALAGCGAVTPLPRREGSVCHLYVVRARRRTRLREHLARHGILTGVHYPVPLHLQPAFRDSGSKRGDFPVAERACREILSLPLWPHMAESAVEEVAGRIREL
ncbi:MAG: DegT/DnrJ/EryC1/StrS family aminotransferase [Bryobacteraceae bacterium]